MDIGEHNAEMFLQSLGYRCARFSKQEMRQGKTPDFRVFHAGKLILFCESKHLQKDRWLDDQLAASPSGSVVGGIRHDSAFNRISAHIHEAAKQFRAVNPKHDVPNVLYLTSSDKGCTFADLISTLTGNLYLEGGETAPILKSVSEGRIKEEKFEIDLYILRDDFNSGQARERAFFVQASPHFNDLCILFGADAKTIKAIR